MTSRITVIAAAAALLAGPALAGSTEPPLADPVITPAAPVLAGPDWTGFFAGGQLGYADVDTNIPGVGGDDVIGGLTLGYDYDFGSYVLGGALDYDFADIGLAPGLTVDNVFRAKLRGGVKIGNGLAYGTGGYAQADTSTLGDDDGYFVGLGYEQLLSDNFSVGAELLYHEFDNFSGTPVDVDATTVQLRGTFRF